MGTCATVTWVTPVRPHRVAESRPGTGRPYEELPVRLRFATMRDEELKRLHEQEREDRKLIEKAADALAEIDRREDGGLIDRHADVLAALRIRLEGKKRASLDELMAAAGDLGSKKDLGDVLGEGGKKDPSDWPVVEEKKRDWPTL